MQEHQKVMRRGFNQQAHNRNLDHTIKSLEDEIQLTIYNYENILQTEKKNSSDRSQFLLYLIQSLRARHLEEIEAVSTQIQNAEAERESVQSMQKQMENIGEGLDQIMQESHKLKAQNESLQKQLKGEEKKQNELDQQIQNCEKEINENNLKIDEWQRIKIKWNRHKKELLELIESAEKDVVAKKRNYSDSEDQDDSLCMQSGYKKKTCQHCQKNKIQELRLKYTAQFRRST